MKSILKWQIDMGADEAVDDVPRNYFAAPKIEVPTESIQQAIPTAAPILKMQASPSLAAGTARELADKATSLQELEAAIREFDGCSLKKMAQKTVFSAGNPKASIMIIGDAPGDEEDQQGTPFCGPSGVLLDKMFAAIGMNRENDLYITNTVFWRPPGNRQPSAEEAAICVPFLERHIALIAPKLLVLAGGTAASALLARPESISRLRGKTYPYTNPYLTEAIPALITYHPSYLLRQPTQKRAAWQDMKFIRSLL